MIWSVWETVLGYREILIHLQEILVHLWILPFVRSPWINFLRYWREIGFADWLTPPLLSSVNMHSICLLLLNRYLCLSLLSEVINHFRKNVMRLLIVFKLCFTYLFVRVCVLVCVVWVCVRVWVCEGLVYTMALVWFYEIPGVVLKIFCCSSATFLIYLAYAFLFFLAKSELEASERWGLFFFGVIFAWY